MEREKKEQKEKKAEMKRTEAIVRRKTTFDRQMEVKQKLISQRLKGSFIQSHKWKGQLNT